MTPLISPDPSGIIDAIANVLGHTTDGLTRREIENGLKECSIPFPDATSSSKREFLFSALHGAASSQIGPRRIVRFLAWAVNPARFTKNPTRHEALRSDLSRVFAPYGYRIDANGSFSPETGAAPLESLLRCKHHLRSELEARRPHPDVLGVCPTDLDHANYAHATLDVAKTISTKIRALCNIDKDGAKLIDEALGGFDPRLATTPFVTQTEKDEHTGFLFIVKGFFLMFRNVAAHAPSNRRSMREEDFLDLCSLASLIHRRLDKAVRRRTS